MGCSSPVLFASALTALVGGWRASDYRLMVDAGSTGSRLEMYRHTDAGLVEVIPSQEDDDSSAFRVTPGIASYASTPHDAGPSLQALLNAAARYIPLSQQSVTPLWVKSTAGMRYTSIEEAFDMTAALKEYLSNRSNCPFDYVSFNIISGTEEAVFAYITVKSVLGHSIGIMELGGASTQIAFPSKVDVRNFEANFYLGGARHAVYAVSYSGFGIVKALERAKALIAASFPDAATLEFPCYHRGYREEATIQGSGHERRVVEFIGTGNGTACSELTRRLLHLDYECTLPPCAIAGRHQSTLSGPFLALSAFWYVVYKLGLVTPHESKVLTPGQIRSAASSICAKNVNEAEADRRFKWKYQYSACFDGYFVWNLLTAYGFHENCTDVTFANRINGVDIGWTKGAIIYEEDNPVHLPDMPTYAKALAFWRVIAAALGGLVVLLCIVVARMRSSRTKDGREVLRSRDSEDGYALAEDALDDEDDAGSLL